jgi:hypothetical protein
MSNSHYPRVDKLKLTFETDVLQLLLRILDIIALKFTIGLHKLVAMIFAVSFEIIIQRAVGNGPYYLIKTL